MSLVENGLGILGNGTLKYAVSKEWGNELSCFFACWYGFRKAENYFNNYFNYLVKTVCSLKVFGTLKFTLSRKWID